MKRYWLVGHCLLLVSVLCHGADLGVVTIVDGEARLLRGVSWYKLSEGVRVQDSDVVDAADRAQVQIEMATGPTANVVGPAQLLAVAAGSHEGKQAAAAEIYLTHGWLKLAAKPGGAPLRVRSPSGTVTSANGVAVMHVEPELLEAFVESGGARLVDSNRAPGEAAVHDLKGGQFAIRASDRPFATSDGAPQPFVSAMPRQFRDPLPTRAALYQVAHVQLVTDRAITYAEAEPWLAGPYRRAFLKRLQPRLADPDFRAAVMAKPQAYPEWQGGGVASTDSAQPGAPDAVAKSPDKAQKAEKTEKTDNAQKSNSAWGWLFGNSSNTKK